MVFLVPTKRCGLAELETDFSVNTLRKMVASIQTEENTVVLPRFQFQSRSRLRSYLVPMGMSHGFSTAADFSGINPESALRLNDVIHVGSIEVDEEGTVAAAGTAATIQQVSAPPPPLRIDQPFVFVIRDKVTGNILFIGRVADPR
jgi:serpin B